MPEMTANFAWAIVYGQRIGLLAHAVKPPLCGLLTLRLQLVFSQYLLCNQHHSAIMLLFAHGTLDGSARALFRPIVESSLRCERLMLIATGEQLKRIAEHDDRAWKTLKQMAKSLDDLKKEDFRANVMETDTKHIHSFTHGGSQALARNISPTGIVSVVPNLAEAANVIRKSAMLLANAGLSLALRLRQYETARQLRECAIQPCPYA